MASSQCKLPTDNKKSLKLTADSFRPQPAAETKPFLPHQFQGFSNETQGLSYPLAYIEDFFPHSYLDKIQPFAYSAQLENRLGPNTMEQSKGKRVTDKAKTININSKEFIVPSNEGLTPPELNICEGPKKKRKKKKKKKGNCEMVAKKAGQGDSWSKPILTSKETKNNAQNKQMSESKEFIDDNVKKETVSINPVKEEKPQKMPKYKILKIAEEVWKKKNEGGENRLQKTRVKFKAITGTTQEILIKKKRKRLTKLKQKIIKYKEEVLMNKKRIQESRELIQRSSKVADNKLAKAESEYETVEEIEDAKAVEDIESFEKFDITRNLKDLSNTLERMHFDKNMKLRDWVDHKTSQDIDIRVIHLVNKLAYFQAMKKVNQPLKAKKRVIAGIKEVYKTLNTTIDEKRSKLLVIAINNQENQLEGGLDQHIRTLISICKQKEIPVIHACSRKMLGLAFTGKNGNKISVISIINYQGCDEAFKELINVLNEARTEYLNDLEKNI